MQTTVVEKKFTFPGHEGPVYALEQGTHTDLFYSGSGDHRVVEWNLATRESGTMILHVPDTIYSLKFLPEKKLLLAGQSRGGIHVVDLSQKRELKLLAWHQAPVFDMAVSNTHGLIISAGGDGNVIFTDLSDFSLKKVIPLGHLKLRAVALSPDENQAAIGCQDGTIVILNLPQITIEKRFQAHKAEFSVNCCIFVNSGRYLISGGRDACLNIFDVENNFSKLNTIPAHNYAIYHLVTSPDGNLLASASRDKTIKIWQMETMSVIQRLDQQGFDGHINSVNRLLWTPSNMLISGGDDRIIMAWEVSDIRNNYLKSSKQ